MNSIDLRKHILSNSKNQIYDVFVIGGGINGAGVAREASLAGCKTILCEKNDFASGTSSTSSCMLHGGLRYLQYGKFKLVKEALQERNLLLELCPEIAKTQQFVFPIIKSRIFYYFVKLGLVLYDFLAGTKKLSKHKSMSRKEFLNRETCINSQNLIGAHLYTDALVNDSQLTLSTIFTSVNDNNLNAVNYAKVLNYKFNGKIWKITVQNELNGEILEFQSKSIVSCVGVWINEMQQNKYVRPTKGIHIVVKHKNLPINCSIVIPTTDNRIIFMNKAGKYVYIGTTDTDYTDSYDSVNVRKEDISYLLEQINPFLPTTLALKKTDIITTWAGLRPLIYQDVNSRKNTREEKILTGKKPIVFVLGGKLTTFRNISQKTVSTLSKYIKIDYDIELSKSQTIRHHQTCTHDVQKLITYHINNTMALKLEDIFFRRTNFYRYSVDNGLTKVNEVATIMANLLNWSKKETKDQIENYKNKVKKMRLEIE